VLMSPQYVSFPAQKVKAEQNCIMEVMMIW